MRSIMILFSIVLLVTISSCVAKDLIVGTTDNARLAYQQIIEETGIPLQTVVKTVFYSDPGQQIIKGIIARNVDNSEGSATIMAGGVGYFYVTLRFKGGYESDINYQVEIYV